MWLGFCESQPCRRCYLCAVPILLGMARQMAVGRLDFSHRALRDARHDVFANRICSVGN